MSTMSTRLTATFGLHGGQKPICDMREAAKKCLLGRYNDEMAIDAFRVALSRALWYDQRTRTSGAPDDYPEEVQITIVIEPKPKQPAKAPLIVFKEEA